MVAKRVFLLIISFFLLFIASGGAIAQVSPKIYFFYGDGCPHCAEVEKYFEENQIYDKYPVEKLEVYFNRDNAVFYTQTLDDLGVAKGGRGVPTVVIGRDVIVGDSPIIDNFTKAADAFLAAETKIENTPTTSVAPSSSITPTSAPSASAKEQEKQGFDLTLAAVVGASLVDAINPCAFAVLIILMTTVLVAGDSKRALKSGFAFATSVFISYFLMGLGLYKALAIGGISAIFYKVVGWLAIILGLFNLKDYFWYGKGFLMEVPMSWRPRLKGLIQSVTSPMGAFAVGFLVSLFLLPCTSGPYIVILGMLAKKALQAKAVFYLILYNLIFVSPMILISWAVYKGFKPEVAEEMRQKRLRTLHLIAGLIMLAMGTIILMGWI